MHLNNKHKWIITLLLGSIVSSCWLHPGDGRNIFTIINNSDYNIQIKSYNKIRGLFNTIDIKAKSEYNKPSGVNLSEAQYHIIDSISITFDNKKYIIQYCDGKPLADFGNCKVDKNLQQPERTSTGKSFDGIKYNSVFSVAFDNLDYEKTTELIKR
jgi:hypothetical protein